jgi:alkylation response protein AidB-like acyl-CoA dehydrogenase
LDFGIRDDDQMIVDSLTAFASEQLRPNLRAAEAARAPSPEVRASFAELGFEALDVPEAANGVGLGILTRALANRTLGQADAGAALALDRLGPAVYVLDAFGGAEAVARFAGPVLENPQTRVALVVENEDRGLAAGGKITGIVPWAPVDRADLVVGLGPASAWVMQGGASAEPVKSIGLHAAGASRLTLDGAAAEVWTDQAAAELALAKVRLYYASLLVGVLYDSTEFSRKYAMERVAFGQPVAHHQGMAFMIVDMFNAVEQVRLLVEDAARRIEAGQDGRQHAAAAFVEAVDASRYVGPNGVQILGGHGFMRDFPMEKAMRETRALGLLAGGVERARDDAAALADTVGDAF